MAVAVQDSLANRGKGGRSCRRRDSSRPSVLETAIRINGTVDPGTRLIETNVQAPSQNLDHWYDNEVCWQKFWDPRRLTEGCTFWLGSQGQLRVVGLISQTGLLMTWDERWVERVRELLEMAPSGPRSICHYEFSGEMWGVVMRPLPIHVMAQG